MLWFGEKKKYTQKSAGVSDLVIFRDVSLKMSSKNEPNIIQTKFHHFIINLKYLRFIYTKCPHYYETRLSAYQLIHKKRISCSIEI